MISNYFTLRALVSEWQGSLVGAEIAEIFPQQRDEIIIAHASATGEGMIRLSVRAPFHYVFRLESYARARRNVADLFPPAVGRSITSVRIAHRDRIIRMDLDGGDSILIALYGPRANVFLVGADGLIADAFQRAGELRGTRPPEPRPAPAIEDLAGRWRRDAGTVAQALAAAAPILDPVLVQEAAFRAEIDPRASPDLDEELLLRLSDSVIRLEGELERPQPLIYWREHDPELFSLVRLSHRSDLRAEAFPSVNEGVAVFVRRSLARRMFLERYAPLEKSLAGAAEHFRAASERMLDELGSESRADRYEKWAHLLMTAPDRVPPGAERVEVEDLFDGGRLEIPLDPSLNAVENAGRLYERARKTRRSREEAEKRLMRTSEKADDAARLLADLRAIKSRRDLEAFEKDRSDDIARVLPEGTIGTDGVSFRRFELPGGYEVWVGRNARQNDELTFRYARKYDLWMHARGVAGSHAVLRLPNRNVRPGKDVLEAAAAIAAYFSKARGSGLVPVIVAERKFVRKPRGAAPGAVTVEREKVILAAPALPA